MLAVTNVKMSGSEKNRVNRNTNISSIKRVNRKLKEVSRLCFAAKQRQGNVQKKCAALAKLFFC